jgi:hypothetical protein
LLNSKEEIADKILERLNNPKPYVENAKEWIIINQSLSQEAFRKIVEVLIKIVD